MTENYYKVLNLSRQATAADIKKQFRKLAVEHHPDKNQGNKAAEALMKKINEAYGVLGDEALRKKYDQQLDALNNPPPIQPKNNGSGNNNSGGGFYHGYRFENWFEFWERITSFMPGGRSSFDQAFNTKYDHVLVIYITQEEANSGCQKPLNYVSSENCIVCHGRKFSTGRCGHCIDGKITFRSKSALFNLPAHVPNDSYWQIPNELEVSPAGDYGKLHDLYVNVKIITTQEADTYDVHFVVRVPLSIAFNGGKLKVDAPRGMIKVSIPALTYTGIKLRVPNRGYINNQTGYIGDLYLTCNVDYPENPTRTEELQMEKLRELFLKNQD